MKPQKIQVTEKRLTYFPKTFLIDGTAHTVIQVERTQTSHKQLCFTVKDENNIRWELVETVEKQTWTGRELEMKVYG